MIKEKLKDIYGWFIRLFQTLVSIFSILTFNRCKTSRRLRKEWRERDDKPVSIISNGPSAYEIVNKRGDLLKGTDLLVLNNFGNQEVFFHLKPRYYILLDPAYFSLSFTNKGLNEKGNDSERKEERKLIENFKKVDWEITLFLPAAWVSNEVRKIYTQNANITVILYNATRVLGYDGFQNRMYHRGAGVPSSRNVIIPAMLLMGILGYKKIYLYGCEFSWTKTMDVDPENGKMFFNDRHFYSKEEIRYFGKGAYLWWLKVIAEDLDATEQVAKYAHRYGIRIINRTKGSFIDSFEYENPDKV